LRAALPARARALRGGAAPVRGRGRPRALRPLRARARGGGGTVSEPLLRTEGLTRHFRVGKLLSRQMLHAVDDVELTIGRGQIVALVGESGSGKSTIARLLARVYRPTSGEIYFEGKPLSRRRSRKRRLAYSSDVPMVFQDPYASINPAYRIAHGIRRGVHLHRRGLGRKERAAEVERVLDTVGLVPAGAAARKFPY